MATVGETAETWHSNIKKENGLEAKMQHKPPVLFTLMVFSSSVLEKHSLMIIHHATLLSHDKPVLPIAW